MASCPASASPTVSAGYLPAVAGTAVIGDHQLRLLFSDGTVGDVDFSAERWSVREGTRAPASRGLTRPLRPPDAK
jgi:hypothetical protein